MPRPSRRRVLNVSMNGEHVGQWVAAPNMPQEFTYAVAWTEAEDARPISLSLPITDIGIAYKGLVVERFFENLLPDNSEIRARIRRYVNAESVQAFDLLAKIGRDCIGALQISPDDEVTPTVRSIDGTPVDDAEIEQILLKTSGSATLGRLEEDDDFRISLAGAQEKTALLRVRKQWLRPHGATPSTHILKLPIGQSPFGIDLSTSVENEWLCAEIMRAYGFATATCEMARFGGQKALIVERFDRRLAQDGSWIIRLPQEDFCQATGTDREQKYEADGGPGIEKIMGILLGAADPMLNRLDFFRTQIVFWMLCATDGHAKNFSLFLESRGRYRLTPRYDVMSAFPVMGKKSGQLSRQKIKMAMAVQSGKNRHYRWDDILKRHFEGTAKRCAVAAEVESLFEDLIERTPYVLDVVQRRLPANFPSAVSDPILNGLTSSAKTLAA